MKSNRWFLCGLVGMTAATVLAQEVKPAPGAPKAGLAFAKDVTLDPPAAATVKNEALNVRDQPDVSADVVARLSRGEAVTVYEEMTLSKPKANEPASWSRIALPTNAATWVFADYVDRSTMTVTRRLNVRGGPGENFKMLTLLEKGTPVTEVRRSQGWIQIVPPTNAFGFVASEYLAAQPPAAPPPAAPPPAAAPVVAVVAEAAAPPAPATNAAPTAPETNTAPPVEAAAPIVAPEPVAAAPAAPEPVAAAPTNAAPPAPAPAATTEEIQPRIVTREGYVRKALNLQAPTDYELIDVQSGALTEYLQPNNDNFKTYVGVRVAVTGPEMLDRRWPKTPVLQVQTIGLMP
jgi:uncharacterized protein YraI